MLQLLVMLIMAMEVILFILMKIQKFWGGFGAGDDFLGVDLVESIDKGSIFELYSMCNR